MNRSISPGGRGSMLPRESGLGSFYNLQQGINRLFEDMWRGIDLPTMLAERLPAMFGDHYPSLEVRDEGKEIRVVAELPGIDEKEVDVSLKDGVLTLKGDKKAETTEKTEAGVLSERWYGHFERSIAVGEIDEDKVAAEFKNGVLTVHLPKSEHPKENGRKIPIGKAN